MADSILITDFDGTVARSDFYKLIADRYLPPGAPDYWARYANNELTHFEAMRAFFAHAPGEEAAVTALLSEMDMDPAFAAAVDRLRANGWDMAVVSAGSSWYIDRLLAAAGVQVEVHSNPGSVQPGRGLWIELPRESPFLSEEIGIDKRAVVEDALGRYKRVAFAGDGPPDLPPALLAHSRFARGWLAGELERRGVPFTPFDRWSEIATALTQQP